MSDWDAIAGQIEAASGRSFRPKLNRTVGGGCINTAVRLSDDERSYFVKLNAAGRLDMFEAEAAGLAEMAETCTIRVPKPLCTGTADGQSYIVMENIVLGGHRRNSAAEAGRQLAAMHRTTRRDFGWNRDNTIGSTPQPNGPQADWAGFWRDRRLGFQLDLAARRGYGGRLQSQGERLLDVMPALIDHGPEPSLLHGDLWGGNMSFDPEGHPVIYDPAVYYGDREADLAMTELFGGFGGDFYAAYRDAWPLDPGYRARRTLYNLYHILNHLNLFGSGYLGQAQDMIERLLAAAR
ncbi:MAG: fructosamine kinase family protein [Pseudomonadota bacterium]|nr:fructosamine kinase family protein [Pseudomonadota bacterium]